MKKTSCSRWFFPPLGLRLRSLETFLVVWIRGIRSWFHDDSDSHHRFTDIQHHEYIYIILYILYIYIFIYININIIIYISVIWSGFFVRIWIYTWISLARHAASLLRSAKIGPGTAAGLKCRASSNNLSEWSSHHHEWDPIYHNIYIYILLIYIYIYIIDYYIYIHM